MNAPSNASSPAPAESLSILPMGTPVRLPDGTEALAYRECGLGRPFSGTYVTAQILNGVERRDYGWRREQLEVVL